MKVSQEFVSLKSQTFNQSIMNKQKAAELATGIRELADKTNASTGKDFRLFRNDSNGDHEIKVFEKNTDGTISGGIITITDLVALAEKFKTNCIVRVEHKDGKGTKGRPYFSFF